MRFALDFNSFVFQMDFFFCSDKALSASEQIIRVFDFINERMSIDEFGLKHLFNVEMASKFNETIKSGEIENVYSMSFHLSKTKPYSNFVAFFFWDMKSNIK